VKAGAKVKSIVQQNFRLGGFQDGALQKWPETRRQSSGGGTDSRRGPLMSSRKVLYNGTGYTPGDACVTIFNRVIYAGIHNEGAPPKRLILLHRILLKIPVPEVDAHETQQQPQ